MRRERGQPRACILRKRKFDSIGRYLNRKTMKRSSDWQKIFLEATFESHFDSVISIGNDEIKKSGLGFLILPMIFDQEILICRFYLHLLNFRNARNIHFRFSLCRITFSLGKSVSRSNRLSSS